MVAVASPELQVNDEERKRVFAERLRQHLLTRGWSPSDLGRAAGLNRDNTSRYLRGLGLPNEKSLLKLSSALKVEPGDLVPGADPAFPVQRGDDFRVVQGSVPGLVRLTVDKHVSAATAMRIVEILNEEAHFRVAVDRN